MSRRDSDGCLESLIAFPFQLIMLAALNKDKRKRQSEREEQIREEDWGELWPKDEEVPYEFTNV